LTQAKRGYKGDLGTCKTLMVKSKWGWRDWGDDGKWGEVQFEVGVPARGRGGAAG